MGESSYVATERASSSARWVIAAASLGAATVHVAAIPVHFDHATRYGVAFVIFAAVGLAATVVALGARSRVGMMFVGAANAAIAALWVIAVTTGLPGEPTEAASVSGAVTAMLELAAVAAVVVWVALRAGEPARARRWPTRWQPAVVALSAVALLVVPGVANASDHDHDDAHVDSLASMPAGTEVGTHAHPGQEVGVTEVLKATSITGIYSQMPPVAHGGTAAEDHGAGVPCAPSDGQVVAADRLVAATTMALVGWSTPQAAVAAGYRPLGFEPNGVYHYLNPAFMADDAVLDPTRPESILYGRTTSGALYAVGAMYMMTKNDDRGPRVGGCLTPWHRHGFPFAPIGQSSVEMMHVWTIPVPGGPFAGHVEGEYARGYLGVDPVAFSADEALPGSDAVAAIGALERIAAAVGVNAQPGAGIVVALNALNVHRDTLCTEPMRRALVALIGDAALVGRLCDPLMNGPLPGARADDLAPIVAAVLASRPN